MFFHKQELQHHAKPEKADAVYARKLQEVLGGQYGEITVAMQYSFQAWSAHIPGKYRDLLFSVAAEEFSHVEMLATMIAQLLEKAPVGAVDGAVQSDPTIAAIVGGTDVQHAIVAGAGPRPVDSNGNPWQGSYITASGNLLADFTANANAELQGRLQVARLYHMTDDKGVRDMLGFLIERDTMHQRMWTAAAMELQEKGIETMPVPDKFPRDKNYLDASKQFINFSDGANAADGPWAQGPVTGAPEEGDFEYLPAPNPGVPMPAPTTPDPRFYGTTAKNDTVEKVTAKVKDALHRG
ncbi:manganese catalase family protein [Kineococcus glutinatus]|uniref:Manganese catalase family protein n=1 Tax=Kineococcus glutinatus TaxID=1070872 RepID=A0ABP9H8S5_9ACTN